MNELKRIEWQKLINSVRALHEQEKDSRAETLAEKALKFAEESFGGNSLKVAETCDILARIYNRQNKIAEAKAYYNREHAIKLNTLVDDGQYDYGGWEPIVIYEVLLPKKMSYVSKLEKILDSFLSHDKIREVLKAGDRFGGEKIKSEKDRERVAKTIKKVISGYSIYEVDGRFAGDDGPVDERVWVIRFIVRAQSKSKGMFKKTCSLADDIIGKIIVKGFSEGIGKEDAVWAIKHEKCSLVSRVKNLNLVLTSGDEIGQLKVHRKARSKNRTSVNKPSLRKLGTSATHTRLDKTKTTVKKRLIGGGRN